MPTSSTSPGISWPLGSQARRSGLKKSDFRAHVIVINIIMRDSIYAREAFTQYLASFIGKVMLG